MTDIVLPARFCGPPGSANGGYACGRLAEFAGAPEVEVTLRRPPPLERPLTVVAGGGVGGAVQLLVDAASEEGASAVVAEARAAPVAVEPPPPVPYEEAVRLAATAPWLRHPEVHPFPGCFVCGPHRAPGDGLRLFPVQAPGRAVFPAPWVPDESVAGDGGAVRPEIVWAALDCPSSFGMYLAGDPVEGTFVLGRLAARLDAPVRVGEPHVVVGWRTAVDGRKMHAACALYDAAGAVLAVSRATWVRIGPAPGSGGS